MEGPANNRRPQQAAVVRATHWVSAAGTLALIVSGGAILLAHPRLYWGETGAVGTPALIDLPIPFPLGHSGWGRYLHFLILVQPTQADRQALELLIAASGDVSRPRGRPRPELSGRAEGARSRS